MRVGILSVLIFLHTVAAVAEPVTFKTESSSSLHWLPFTIGLMLLCVILYWITRRHAAASNTVKNLNLIEQVILNPKTSVYLIEYKQQQFLIAQNPNSVAIHALLSPTAQDT